MDRLHAPWLFLLALAVFTGTAEAAEPGVQLSLDPATVDFAPGERRYVVVRASGVPETGLAAFQIELRFDPRTLQIADPNAGYSASSYAPLGGSPLCAAIRGTLKCTDPEWMLTSTARQAVGTSSIDPAKGSLTIAYGTSGETAPATGDGALALIEVVGKTRGRASLRLVDAILADATDPPRIYPWKIQTATPRPVRER